MNRRGFLAGIAGLLTGGAYARLQKDAPAAPGPLLPPETSAPWEDPRPPARGQLVFVDADPDWPGTLSVFRDVIPVQREFGVVDSVICGAWRARVVRDDGRWVLVSPEVEVPTRVESGGVVRYVWSDGGDLSLTAKGAEEFERFLGRYAYPGAAPEVVAVKAVPLPGPRRRRRGGRA